MTPIAAIAPNPPGSFDVKRSQAQALGVRLAEDDHRRHRYTLVADRTRAARIGLSMTAREVYAFNRAYATRWNALRCAFERSTKTQYQWRDNPSLTTTTTKGTTTNASAQKNS